MRKKYIIIPGIILIFCSLLVGAYLFGKSQNSQQVINTKKERTAVEGSLKTKTSSSCIDEVNKTAANEIQAIAKQDIADALKANQEAEVRERLRTAVLSCSM